MPATSTCDRIGFPLTTSACIGFIGVHADIIAAFLCYLRYRNGAADIPNPRKASTVTSMWCQTKAGLRQIMQADELPAFAKPRAAPAARETKLLKQWRAIDLRTMPVKSYLLESQIEDFCMEAIWYHMQAPDTTADVKLFLLHALILRIQSGTDCRHADLTKVRWTDVHKHEYVRAGNNGYYLWSAGY